MQTIMYQLAAAGRDQPIDQTSNNFRELNYGVDVYYKTASYLLWLENYMGKEQFQSGIQDYYNTWKFKHPYPEDFRTVMQKHTNKPIDWFFEEVLKTDRLIDFKIADVRSSPDGVDVTVRNKTSHTLPVAVGAYAGDSLLATGHALPFRGNTTVSLPATAAGWTRLKISPFIPDGRTPNNEYRKKGLFHRSGLRLAPFVGTNLSNKQKLFILPALGYNLYDGFQAGLLLHNLSWPQTKFRFALTPLHGFRSKNFNGAGSIGYNWIPQRTFKEVMFQADFKSFSYQETERNIPGPIFVRYMKLAPSVNLTLRQASPLSTVRRTITLKGYAINEESFDFNMDPSDSLFKPSIVSQENYYGLLRYTHNNDRTFNPFSYSAEVQIGENFAKINLEGNLRIDYHSKDKSLYIRAFGGKFISLKDEPFVTDRYYLNTTFTGPNDYLYDDTYIGRSEREGFGARQISMREGGFKIPTPLYADPLGRSDNWLVALNLKTDLPLKRLPIRLYMDVASFADAAKLNPSGSKILYNGGVEIHFLDILNIYLPLVMSKDFKEYQQSISGNDSILDGITFSLSLHKINWLKAPSGVLKLM